MQAESAEDERIDRPDLFNIGLHSGSDSDYVQSEPQSSSEINAEDVNSLQIAKQAPRKRKRNEPHGSRGSKRHKASLLSYVDLLNSAIQDASLVKDWPNTSSQEDTRSNHAQGSGKHGNSPSTQRGRQHQTLGEGFPKGTGPKSDIEVLGYQHLLKCHSTQDEASRNVQNMVSRPKSEAAFELSQSCCEALEQAADAVASLQWSHEKQREELRYGQFGLLNGDDIEHLERVTGMADHSDKDVNESEDTNTQLVHPSVNDAFTLLNLENWLALSERIFMNSAALSQTEAKSMGTDDQDRPCLLASAFTDFFNIAVSFTRRIVFTAHFHAMSRLRATDGFERRRKGQLIKKRDVLTALNTLGIRSDRQRFWRFAARRLKLEVYAKKLPQWHKSRNQYHDYEERLAYDEVERELASAPFNEPKNAPLDAFPGRRDSKTRVYRVNTDDVDEDASEQDGESDALLADSILDDNYEEDLDSYDRNASLMEENRLWSILGDSSQASVSRQDADKFDEAEASRATSKLRKDWREEVDFRADWERYGAPLVQGIFHNTTHTQKPGPTTSLGSSTDLVPDRNPIFTARKASSRQSNSSLST